MKKYSFTKNPGLKIMALVFATFLWLIVVNIDNPVSSDTYLNIPVTIINDDIITQEGNVYRVMDEQNVNVIVYAKRQALQNINADDIVATADIREMDTDTGLVPIKVTIPEYTGDYESAEAIPRNLQIKTEKTGKKVLSLTVDTQGTTPRDGYVLGSMTVNPERVTLTGSESMIDQIETAAALINVEGISKDTDVRAELALYDANGNEMTNSQIGNNLGEEGITVHVEVLQTKTVPVEFHTSGTPAEGYQVTDVTSEPDNIQICGKSSDLSTITAIEVPASELNVEGASSRIEKTIDITPYLPEGTALVDENTGSVNVAVIIEEEGTRSVEFLVSSIRINNLSEKLQVVYEPDAEITLQFSGNKEMLDLLDISNAVSVDLTDYREPGTYEIPVKVNTPQGITLVNEVKVQLILEEKSEDLETGEQ